MNSRLDAIQAALRLFLGHVDRWNAERREAAARYAELGLGELCELPEDDPGHVYHMYVVRSPERDHRRGAARRGHRLRDVLHDALHLQPVYQPLGYEAGSLPETERAARETIALPLWAGITVAQQEEVVATISSAVETGATHEVRSRHRIWQVAADGLLVALAWYLAFQVRFDQGVPGRYDEFLGWDVFVVVAIKLAVFVAFGLYEHWWRYVSIRDMWRAFLAVTVASIAVVVVLYLWRPVDGWRVPRGSSRSTGSSSSPS